MIRPQRVDDTLHPLLPDVLNPVVGADFVEESLTHRVHGRRDEELRQVERPGCFSTDPKTPQAITSKRDMGALILGNLRGIHALTTQIIQG